MENNQTFIKKIFTKKKEITTKLGEKITISSVKNFKTYKKKKYILNMTKNEAKISKIIVMGSLGLFLMLIPFEFQRQKNNLYQDYLNSHQEILEDYNEYLNYYAEYYNNLEIDNNLEMIMKLIYDMRKEIVSYNMNAAYDFSMAYRLAFTYQGGEGVCKNMADDLTAKLNAINPDLNARNLIVYDGNNQVEDIYKIIGNHMVTIISPKDEDYTIVIDPTNTAIGFIVNGRIQMIYKNSIIEYYYCPIGQAFTVYETTTNDVNYEFIKSFINYKSNDEINELFEKYGEEAQLEAFTEAKCYEAPKEKKLYH